MKHLLSTNVNDREWADRPLLPAVLTAAGYNVGYFDNQSTPATCDVVDYGSVFFLNAPATSAQCFSARNDLRFDYDSDFVNHYLPQALAIEEPSAIFFHLMGQHIQASKRYKPEESAFSVGDYESSGEFSEKERTDIMHYDNATYATVGTIAHIMQSFAGHDAVVIYLSDHSEEIYDYRHQYGRTQEPMTPERARTLFEVPMYVYMTDEFINRHPEKAKNLKANASSRVFTYDLPDLVLDLAGIRGDMIEKRHSIASDSYDGSRRRMIHNFSVDYDSLMNRARPQ